MISRTVALVTEGKAITRPGSFAHMVVDRVRAAAARIIFQPGTGPVVLGSFETEACRRIAVAGIASATLKQTVDMQGTVYKNVGIAVAGRIDIAVAVAGIADRYSC